MLFLSHRERANMFPGFHKLTEKEAFSSGIPTTDDEGAGVRLSCMAGSCLRRCTVSRKPLNGTAESVNLVIRVTLMRAHCSCSPDVQFFKMTVTSS